MFPVRAASVFLVMGGAALAQQYVISTIAGGHNNTFQSNGGNGGPAISAYVNTTSGVVVDADGVFYFVDTSSTVRKVSKNGIISTVAGTGIVGFSGDGGLAILAQFNGLSDLALDAFGNLYMADSFNNRVRKVSTNGIITTVAGGGTGCVGQTNSLGDGCPATSATIGRPDSIAFDPAGNLYLTDFFNQRVRKVSVNGIITTVAGNGQDHCCLSVDGSPAINAYLTGPTAVAVDAYGNVFIGDYASIRKVSKNGIITTVAGGGVSGFSGDGGTAITAKLSISPGGMVADNAGQLYISDYFNNRIRKVAIDGTITTIAGGGTGCAGQTNTLGDGCPATSAKLSLPVAPAIDVSGNIYIADSGDGSIRLLNPGTAITLTANAFGEIPLLAPNTWVEIKGTHLAPVGDARIWQGSDFVNNQMPTQLDAVSVTVNGRKAFVYFISGTQVNILTPPDAITGPVQVQITNGTTSSAATTVPAQQYSPSFFVFDTSHVTGTHVDGSLLGPVSLYPGSTTPAKPNEIVTLYANGFGPTSTPLVSGSVVQSGNLSPLPVVKIGGITATVQFAGLVSPGLYQFNVVVPAATPDGDNALTATYNGSSVQPGVLIAVQH